MRSADTIAPVPPRIDGELKNYCDALADIAVQAGAKGDAVQAEKFKELADKLELGRLTIAFCGHFSAGKSTLVNTICGAQLLPASPIPTSANVVTILNGEPYAETVFRDASGTEHPARRIAVEDLHGFAVDGEGVSSIRVSYPIPLLGDRMAIVDTPGVDSTDGAHRAATESALHLADVVFFVADYNHVQSEVNFRFLRSLARWGKPTYIIVNQIDKHREEQLSFAEFQISLRQALDNWGIAPAGIISLSLRDLSHPLSQWEELKRILAGLQPLATPLMVRSAERSARYLAEQFRETLRVRSRERRERLAQKLGEEDAQRLAALRSELTAQIDGVVRAGDRQREQLRGAMDRLMANANLTPAETRDKAKGVLEAMQPGFKAGWLAGAAKTEAERARRLALLADDFNGQIAANLTGHLRQLLRQEAREAGLDDQAVERSLDAAFAPVPAEWLRQLVKPGAGADGQATLHYAAEIGAELKSQYRKSALQWFDDLEQQRTPERVAAAASLREKLAQLQVRESAAAELAELDDAETAEANALLSLLPPSAGGGDFALPSPAPLGPEAGRQSAGGDVPGLAAVQRQSAPAAGGLAAERAQTPAERAADSGSAHESGDSGGSDGSAGAGETAGVEHTLASPHGAAERLERAAALLRRLPALSGLADGLAAKADRFRDKRFTIALFGAFSAGKSSFANALVGRPVLPVSPNPTTAAINRILAPVGEERDGTALISMKSAEAFAEDVRHSLKRLGVGADLIAEHADDSVRLLALKDRVSADELHPRGRPHLAFLNAAAAGWARFGPLLGSKFVVEEEEYRKYAAEEMASCFVAEIDLYVDSPLTRSGAVLVDTPGADSINARHTGVAFRYIKDADAVLFVTYYNHAFTEADREFLNQLGSVKDAFELDKMFFIINAADLASSAEELDAVAAHVGTQLLKHGIRKPRLYPVSSLLGLQAKLDRNRAALQQAGVADFERAFGVFAQDELGGLALASANKELDRVDKLLEGLLASANDDAATRQAKAAKLQEQANLWRERGGDLLPPAAVQPLLQEIGEQLYHLRQRVKYRFNEHFQSAFHPSVLQDDGRDLKKLLPACWDDLLRSVGEDFLQELRAAGLRLENTLNATVSGLIQAKVEAENAALGGFSPEQPERASLELPLFEPFAGGPKADGRRLWAAFRSPKHFFERDGKTALRDELGDELFQAADSGLAELKEHWGETASAAMQQAIQAAAAALAQQLAAYAHSLSLNLNKPGEERVLVDFQAEWKNIRL